MAARRPLGLLGDVAVLSLGYAPLAGLGRAGAGECVRLGQSIVLELMAAPIPQLHPRSGRDTPPTTNGKSGVMDQVVYLRLRGRQWAVRSTA